MRNVSTATICDGAAGEGRPVSCHFGELAIRGEIGRVAAPLTSHPFSKKNFLGTTDIGLEIAFHQLQGLLVLSRGVGNDAIARNR
jgi:hypothetical protein